MTPDQEGTLRKALVEVDQKILRLLALDPEIDQARAAKIVLYEATRNIIQRLLLDEIS